LRDLVRSEHLSPLLVPQRNHAFPLLGSAVGSYIAAGVHFASGPVVDMRGEMVALSPGSEYLSFHDEFLGNPEGCRSDGE